MKRLLSATMAAMLCLLVSAPAFAGWGHHDKAPPGTVYAMTNASDGNEIRVYRRDRFGRLHAYRHGVRTGGLGGGDNAAVDPLGSQNALLYDGEMDSLFAVNAGDNTVTVFDTGWLGWPRRTDVAGSGGDIPVSVAVADGLVYVLNAGGSGTVATFAVDDDGRLHAVGSLDLGLSNASGIPFDNVMAPGQVGIDTLERRLLVVNAAGQEMLVAALDADGIPQGPLTSTGTPGPVPFAFDLAPYGNILVAEASGSVSAFDPPSIVDNTLTLSAGPVSTTQAASCWIVVGDDYAYVSNTASDTLSQFSFDRTGGLSLVEAVAATPAGAPTDMTFAAGETFLYTLNAASGEISGYRIDEDDGGLTLVETQAGLPASAGIQGLAARDD